MNNRHMLFIDFDGTITASDVGYELFKKFTSGATEADVQIYRAGKLNSLECLTRECATWNQYAPNSQAVYDHLDNQRLSSGFHEFLGFLEENKLKPIILSEGFDFYIDRVLAFHHLNHLERITNKAVFENNSLRPSFPYFELGCRECSNCKEYHIDRLRPAQMSAIYIGDGHSDLHASRKADIVFAKSHLKDLLVLEHRYFIEYHDFFDIIDSLTIILDRGIFALGKNIDLCFVADRHHEYSQRLWESGDVMRYVGYPDGLKWSQNRYDDYWNKQAQNENAIYLAIENKDGHFMGEAMISFPDAEGLCQHDVKLLPEFQHRGLGQETWKIILDRTRERWPKARVLVTPAIENVRAIDMYLKLGFEFNSEPMTWIPSPEEIGAVPVIYRRMIKILK